MKIKKIIPSIMTTLMSLSLITGATYSLFTSTSTHDITVSSGTVKVTSELKNLKLFSLTEDRTKAGTFTNGGTATLNEGKSLTLGNITPGDKVTLDVVINNASTVNVKYRVRCFKKSGDDGLFKALKVESPATDWNRLNPGTEQQPSNDTKNISIELDEAVTDFQGKDVQIGILIEAVQGNVSNDIAHVNSLNGILAAKENADGKNLKVGDALEDIRTEGVTIDNLALADVGNEIVWDQVSDRFAILNNDTITYPSTFGDVTKSNLWKFVTNETYVDNSLYSQYLKDDVYEKTDLTLQAGLDVGNNDEEFTFNLNTDNANKYTIRSNHKESILNITAPNASVSHYGLLGESNVNSVAMNSYHEFGKTRLVSVVKGKVNVEPEAVVSVLAAKPVATQDVVIQKEETAIIKTAVITNDVEIETNEKLELVTEDTVKNKVESAVKQENAAEAGYDLYIVEADGTEKQMNLSQFRDEVNKDKSHINATVNVVRDIDLGGVEWDPIGRFYDCYHGTFNGNYYTISNFKPLAYKRAGLFGRVGVDGDNISALKYLELNKVYDEATNTVKDPIDFEFDTVIKNLNIDNAQASIRSDADKEWGFQNYGVLVGCAYNTRISNINVSNSSVKGHVHNGIIAGYIQDSVIENCNTINCEVNATFCETSENSGGIVGRVDIGLINNCVNDAKVNCIGKGFIGGIVGYLTNSTDIKDNYIVINNCKNKATITHERGSVGGIIGGCYTRSICNNVTNNGQLYLNNIHTTQESCGGICGIFGGNSTLINTTNNGDIFAKTEGQFIGSISGKGTPEKVSLNFKNTGKYYLNNSEQHLLMVGNNPEFKLQ